MSDNTMEPFSSFKIYLALSGGGLRATLFHLGVLRFLKQTDYLTSIKQICSVSGGSITAAHLVLNWDRYTTGDDSQFVSAASDLIKGAARFGIRERTDYCFLNPHYRFEQLKANYIQGLGSDKQETLLKDVISGPNFHILGTDFSTGRLIAFSRDGIAQYESTDQGLLWKTDKLTDETGQNVGLWRSVACSTAFPPLFPPHLIPPGDYSPSLDKNLTVGDGGVYDNLGIRLLEHLATHDAENVLFIISDAGQPFRNALASPSVYKWLFDRLTRASDIQFYRLADADARQFEGKHLSDAKRRVMRIQIGDIVDQKGDDLLLAKPIQEEVCRIRTDLDTFNDEEIHALVRHGWEVARHKWPTTTRLPVDPQMQMGWQPAGRSVTENQIAERLKSSSIRKSFLIRPTARFIAWVILVVAGIAAALCVSMEAVAQWRQPRPTTVSFASVDRTIKDFPPNERGHVVSSLEAAFRNKLDEQSADYFVDVIAPFAAEELGFAVYSGDVKAQILRTWAFQMSESDKSMIGTVVWIQDAVPSGPWPIGPQIDEIKKHGSWDPGMRLRIVFSVTGADAEKLRATVTFSPKRTYLQGLWYHGNY